YFQQDALPLLPYPVHPAAGLERAGTGTIGADVERDRTFDRFDNVAEGDLLGRAGQLIAAPGSPPRLNQSAPHQVANHFFQVVLRNLLVPGDFGSARDTRRAVRHVDHRAQCVLDLGRYLHQAHALGSVQDPADAAANPRSPSIFSTYFTSMSPSKFTFSPALRLPRVVTFRVCGISATENSRPLIAK